MGFSLSGTFFVRCYTSHVQNIPRPRVGFQFIHLEWMNDGALSWEGMIAVERGLVLGSSINSYHSYYLLSEFSVPSVVLSI